MDLLIVSASIARDSAATGSDDQRAPAKLASAKDRLSGSDGSLGNLSAQLRNTSTPRIRTSNASLVFSLEFNTTGRPKELDLGSYYGGFSAVKQPHEMACWAACLSYWGNVCGGGRPKKPVGEIISMYNYLESSDGPLMGGMPTGGLKKILRDQAAANKTSGGEDVISLPSPR